MTCKDRWELTRAALESIFDIVNQSHNNYAFASLFEVTVVDDNSNPQTIAQFLEWVRYNSWFVNYSLNTETLGVGGSKNRAVELARQHDNSKYLCLLDNDVVCKPGWLETLIDAYSNATMFNYKLLGGYAHPFNQTNCRHIPLMTTRQFELHEKNAVDGLCWFMEWPTWDKYGPLDSHVQGVRQSEDWAMCQKIRADGFKVGVVYPHVIENHGVVDTFGERIPGAELVEAELTK